MVPEPSFQARSRREDERPLAALETKGRQAKGAYQVVAASAQPEPPKVVVVPVAKPDSAAPVIQTASLMPAAQAAPQAAKPLELALAKEPPLHLGAPALQASAAPKQIAEGDAVGAPLVAFNPPPVNEGVVVSREGMVKRWAVQIGVFASETLAQAQLAAFARRGVDIVGQAQKLVIPFRPSAATLSTVPVLDCSAKKRPAISASAWPNADRLASWHPRPRAFSGEVPGALRAPLGLRQARGASGVRLRKCDKSQDLPRFRLRALKAKEL